MAALNQLFGVCYFGIYIVLIQYFQGSNAQKNSCKWSGGELFKELVGLGIIYKKMERESKGYSVMFCKLMCERIHICKSILYHRDDGHCLLKKATKREFPSRFIRSHYTYYEIKHCYRDRSNPLTWVAFVNGINKPNLEWKQWQNRPEEINSYERSLVYINRRKLRCKWSLVYKGYKLLSTEISKIKTNRLMSCLKKCEKPENKCNSVVFDVFDHVCKLLNDNRPSLSSKYVKASQRLHYVEMENCGHRETKCQRMQAEQRNMRNINSSFVPRYLWRCDAKGEFVPYQCGHSGCRCVDETGWADLSFNPKDPEDCKRNLRSRHCKWSLGVPNSKINGTLLKSLFMGSIGNCKRACHRHRQCTSIDYCNCNGRCNIRAQNVFDKPEGFIELMGSTYFAYECRNPCQLAPDGFKDKTCNKQITSYFYHPLRGKCKRFKFNNCRGNANRFSSKAKCQAKCSKHKKKIKLRKNGYY